MGPLLQYSVRNATGLRDYFGRPAKDLTAMQVIAHSHLMNGSIDAATNDDRNLSALPAEQLASLLKGTDLARD